MNQGRIVHITLPKCGSQWIRDVLTAVELRPYHSARYSGITLNLQRHPLPVLPDGTCNGPIYGMDRWQWQLWKQPDDKAVVVLRDPRDRLVSEIFSYIYSHGNSSMVNLQREVLLHASGMSDWIRQRIAGFHAFSRFYQSWSHDESDDVLLLRYEDLIRGQYSAFAGINRWLGWDVPEEVLHPVVDRLSFQQQSGRRPGDSDIYSHHRRGVAGDWKNHFHRGHGELWEKLYPGLLAATAYETDPEWWKRLPDSASPDNTNLTKPNETEILSKRNKVLERQNQEKEAEIHRQMDALENLRVQVERERSTADNVSTTVASIEQSLSAQLEAKEQVIQEQAKAIQWLNDQAKREEGAATTLSGMLEELKETLSSQIQAKEQVIQEQTMALRNYRAVYGLLGLNLLIRLRHRGAALLRPRLGNLNHYSPRKISQPRLPMARADRTLSLSISIVTPSLNQGQFVERTLASVLDQNYPNLEYRVQDGGSSDQTLEVLESWQDRLTGWVSEPDQGQSDALNRAFQKTDGEIMAWLNADDVLLPGALDQVAEFFSQHPEVDVVYGNRLLIDENDMEIGRWVLPRHQDNVLSWVDFIPQETLFWRRGIWEKSGGGIDESFQFAMDWDLLVRFREAGATFALINRFLGGFRIHPQQKTATTIAEVGHGEMDRVRERCLGYIPGQADIRRAVTPYLARHIVKHALHRLTRR